MARKYLLTISILITIQSTAQLKSSTIDASNRTPLPHVNVWIAGKDVGTTSDQNGQFLINGSTDSDTLVFSCAGYVMKRIPVREVASSVSLERNVIALRAVTLKNKKVKRIKKVIGEFETSSINSYWSSGGQPYLIGRLFRYEENIKHLPIIKSLKLYLWSRGSSVSNIRLYSADTNGLPDKEISEGNILLRAEDGMRMTAVDLADRGIVFPASGLIVLLETMIIPENRYEVKLPDEGKTLIQYNPSLGVFPSEMTNDTEIYFFKGGWGKRQRPFPAWGHNDINSHEGKFAIPAIQVTLSNY